MSFFDSGESSTSMVDQWSAALGIGSGAEYTTGKTAETVPTNAIGSMTPVDTAVTTPGWEKFMQDTLGGVIGYVIKRDAIQSGISVPASQSGGAVAPAAPARADNRMVLMVVGAVGLGLAVFLAVKLAK